MAAASVVLMLAGVVTEGHAGAAAASAATTVTDPGSGTGVPADEAARGKAFWQDDVLPPKSEEQKASERAAATGTRVEVAGLTNESNQVFANSDGTFTAESSSVVERVRRGDTWVPVDTTLMKRADGQIVPKAAQDVVLSGGGSQQPLAKITRDGKSYELGAPWALPQPTLSGSLAVYAGVRPGVDLVVQVRPDGFTQNLVVHSREAAADPALASIRFPVKTSGLAVSASENGTVSLRDTGGRAVFSSSAALMWDTAKAAPTARSAKTATGTTGQASPVIPDPGSRTAVADVTLADGALALAPDKTFLTAADTTYPVVIDPPAVSATLTGWTTIWSNQPSTSFWKTSHALGVGYDAWVDVKKSKSLFQFDTRRLAGKKILNATFTSYAIWSANCTKKDVHLYRTNSISSATTWNTPPKGAWTPITTVSAAKGFSSNCPDGDIEFNATSAVAHTAAAGGTTTTLALTASDTDPYAWKQFMSPADDRATTSRKPRLSITYVTPPDGKPSNVKMADPNLACSSSVTPAYIRDSTPRLTATPLSADGSNASVRPSFQLVHGNTSVTLNQTSAWTASGTAGSITTPGVVEGRVYLFRARTEYRYTYNGTTSSMMGPWSGGCYFIVDSKGPPAPTLTSADAAYPPCEGTTCDASPEHGGVGTPGLFRATVKTADDVRRYKWYLNGVLLGDKTFPSTTLSFDLPPVTPDKRGSNVLRVQAIDAAGNPSSHTDYLFKVGKPVGPIGQWTFDETTGTSAADTSGKGNTLTVSKNNAWTGKARLAGGLRGNGLDVHATTATPILDTSKSFSVAAWMRLDSTSHNSIAVSQHGQTQMGTFSLYYSSGYNRWIFNRTAADSPSAAVTRAKSTTLPVLGAWTHLLGVHDKDKQEIRLYVNGRLEATMPYTTPWNAANPLKIGGVQAGEYVEGDLDHIQVWNRVTFPDEVPGLVNMEHPQTGQPQSALLAHWEMNEASGTTGADSSGRGNPLQLQPGASFTTSDTTRGNVLALNPALSGHATASSLLDESGSYTVAGWVNLNESGALADTTKPHTITVLAHPGTQGNSFRLWYEQPTGKTLGTWKFGVGASDASGTPAVTVASEENEAPDTWVHVAGVYDSANQSAKLYVAGVRQADPDGAFVQQTFQPTGPLMLGRSRKHDAQWGDLLPGQLDDLRIYAGALSQDDVIQLATIDEPPIEVG
ncbi:LamG domain-containing protein [Streptomyces sp. NPDC003860]